MREVTTEVMILPDGMELDDVEVHSFAILVQWRGAPTDKGRGGYAVIHNGRHLSHAGSWRWNPEPFVQRHYRWKSLELALECARAVVNDVKVNGHTWTEWRERYVMRGFGFGRTP